MNGGRTDPVTCHVDSVSDRVPGQRPSSDCETRKQGDLVDGSTVRNQPGGSRTRGSPKTGTDPSAIASAQSRTPRADRVDCPAASASTKTYCHDDTAFRDRSAVDAVTEPREDGDELNDGLAVRRAPGLWWTITIATDRPSRSLSIREHPMAGHTVPVADLGHRLWAG